MATATATALRRLAHGLATPALLRSAVQATVAESSHIPLARRRSRLPLGAVESLGECRRSFASAASANERDPYKLLGVDRSASAEDIKKAYRREALKWHPDRQPPEKRKEAEARFGAIADAYETLSDPGKKQQHDMGGGGSTGGFPGAGPGGFPGGPSGGFRAGGVHSQADAERLFREVFGGSSLNEVFGQIFNGEQASPFGAATLRVGMEVEVLSDVRAVVAACRRSGIDSTNDSLRSRSLGKRGRIIKVDPSDASVKLKIDGVGDVWFGSGAVKPLGGSAGFPGFGSFGGFGGAGLSGSGVVQMKQEIVILPDGRRVVRVTRVQRSPDGSLHEDVTDTPLAG